MFIRTYVRTLFNDIFKNNFVVKTIAKIVNFYCELGFRNPKAIKFEQNMSIIEMEEKRKLFFQSVSGDKIDCK